MKLSTFTSGFIVSIFALGVLLQGTPAIASSVAFDPAKKYTYITLSSGNLVATTDLINVGASNSVYVTDSVSSKQYVEFLVGESNDPNTYVMVGEGTLNFGIPQDALAYRADAGSTGYVYNDTVAIDTDEPKFTEGDVIGVATDVANDLVWFSKNGTWINSGDPATGTNGYSYDLSGSKYYGVSIYISQSTQQSMTVRPDCSQMSYSPPSGFAPIGDACGGGSSAPFESGILMFR